MTPESPVEDLQVGLSEAADILAAWSAHIQFSLAAQFDFVLTDVELDVPQTAAWSPVGLMVTQSEVWTLPDGPEPLPPGYRISPDTQQLVDRWRAWRNGREPQLASAYFCLSKLEYMFGRRAGKVNRGLAAANMNVARAIFNRVGDLTARNAPGYARKVAAPEQEISADEMGWLMSALRALIMRAIDIESGLKPEQLLMEHIPEGEEVRVPAGMNIRSVTHYHPHPMARPGPTPGE
jgi:hypothetical protein